VTERGRPKALLGPIPGRVRLDEGIAEGWITPGSGEPLRPIGRVQAARPVFEVLGEDRGE
jgi:hypothetical protein